MQLDEEKIKEFDQEEFLKLCECIGYKNLSKEFLEACKNTNKLSKYYIGKINGKYWNGFRINSVKIEKISEILFDELKKENRELDVIETINKAFNSKFGEEIDKEKIIEYFEENDKIEYLNIIIKLLDIKSIKEDDIKIKVKEKKYKEEIEALKKELLDLNKEKERKQEQIDEYKKKNDLIIKDFEKKCNVLKEENIKLKEENNRIQVLEKEKDNQIEEIKKINIKNEKLKNENKEKFDNMLKRIIDNNTSVEEIKMLLEKEKIENKKDLRLFLEKLLELNVKNFKEGNNLSNMLVKEYVLLKMMEE